MPKQNVWDVTLETVFEMHDDIYLNMLAAELILENLIDMNSSIEYYNKEQLGAAGMMVLDMRVDIEDAINAVNQSLAKFEMILHSLRMMEQQVRDNLPEFTIDYEDYKEYINQDRYGANFDPSKVLAWDYMD